MKFITAAIALAILNFTSALPSPQPQNIPSGANIITPTTVSQYEVWTGAVHYAESYGKIFKDGQSTDITTLLTFDFPAASAGKTCELHFVLPSDARADGSAQFDVFTSLAPATQDTTTWPSGNLRDQQAGRLTAYLGAEAQWVSGFPTDGQSFPCPTGILGGELVGAGDSVDIEWDVPGAGAYIKYY